MKGQTDAAFAADLRAVARGTGRVSPIVHHAMMLEAAERLHPEAPNQLRFGDAREPSKACDITAAEVSA